MTICVYGLTGARPGLRGLRGLAGERLTAIASGGVTAVVGELRRRPAPSRTTLTRYDAAGRAIAARVPAVLPARFGTCFEDPEELRHVLRARQRTLQQSLRHVRHRAQMTIRVLRPARRSGGGAKAPRRTSKTSGAAYLRERAAAAAAEREIPGFDPVRASVRRWVRDERVEKREDVASVYHLVPRGSVDAYRRAVERASAAAGLQVVISGPWPPYAFTNL